jgi:hypothetical protein
MAYGLRYKVQAFAKSGKMFTAEISEKDYSGPVDNIPAAYQPFQQNVLASGDDPFEPILASELRAALDITDFTGSIPDLTDRDDKRYHIVLKAGAAPDYNNSIIIWKNYESTTPEFLDCNFQIKVNGLSQVFEFFNNTGELQVSATDTVKLELAVFPPLPPILPIVGAGWRLIVKEDGITVFDDFTQDPPGISAISYTFVAGYQKVYTVLCYSYQIGDDSQTIPVNTIYNIYQGYMLNDNTSLSFSSGRKFLDLSFVDGLGMLQSIPYEQNYAVEAVTPQNGAVMVDINTTQTLLEVILQCLNKLEFPDPFGLSIACNIYAAGMDEDLDVFSQIDYYRRNWQNSDLTWKSCHEILTTICRDFGCQIFQSNNEFWIVNVEERAAGTLRYFRYWNDGTLIELVSNDASRSIVPYTPGVDHYFINGDQTKIVRKGFPVIEINNTYNYAPNLIDNGNLRRPPVATDEIAYNWRKSIPTLGSMSMAEIDGVYYIEMSTGASAATTSIQPLSVPNVFGNDKIEISFDYRDTVSVATTNPILQMRCEVYQYGGTNYYQLTQDRDWKVFTPSPPNYIWVNIESSGTYLSGRQTATISLPLIPVDGNLFLMFRINNPATQLQATIGNFRILGSNIKESKTAKGYFDFQSQYKRTQTAELGVQTDLCYSQVGAMLKRNLIEPTQPTVWSSWYRYGITESYTNLPRLILQQYINIQATAQINIDGSLASIFSANGPLSLINKFDVQDATGVLSVSGKPFIPGSMRINFTDDTWNGTLLQISNTEITETITDVITLKKS